MNQVSKVRMGVVVGWWSACRKGGQISGDVVRPSEMRLREGDQ